MRIAAALILSIASMLVANGAEISAGRWEGAAQIPGLELTLIVDLAQEASAWRGAITIPQLGLRGSELTEIGVKGSELTFAVKSVLDDKQAGPARLKGHLSADGSLTGDFSQAGNTAPFKLVKTGEAQLEKPARSTAIGKEFEGVWKGGYQLLGYPRTVTLTLRNRGTEGAAAEFIIVGRKENNLPVSLITQEGSFLSVNSEETGLSFEGRLENNELQGTIIQGPIEVGLTLERAK
jgi:hypothetical protein